MNDDGSCHVSIVNDCVLDLVKVGVNNSNIIVRSWTCSSSEGLRV